MISVIVASHVRVSLRGVLLVWHRPFEIWQVANERQQPLISDIQRGELWGFPLLLWLVSGSLPVFALSFVGLKQLLPLQLTFSSRLCEAPKPGGPLTTRQPTEYSWMSGNPMLSRPKRIHKWMALSPKDYYLNPQ